MRHLVLSPLVLALACTPPEAAPEDVGEASRYAFAHFDAEEGTELIDALATLEGYMLSLDLSAGINDRAVTPSALTRADLEGLTTPEGVQPSAQIPVAVSALSRHGLQAQRDLAVEPNQVCIESGTTVYAQREFLTDASCFADGTCDTLSILQETRKESLLAKVWYDYYRDYRTLELEDGRTAIYSRGWLEESFPTDGGGSWDQAYGLDLWVPHPSESGTLHYSSFWSSVTVGGIGDDVWASLVKSGLDEANENADDFVDGELCGNDRERENDRPESR